MSQTKIISIALELHILHVQDFEKTQALPVTHRLIKSLLSTPCVQWRDCSHFVMSLDITDFPNVHSIFQNLCTNLCKYQASQCIDITGPGVQLHHSLCQFTLCTCVIFASTPTSDISSMLFILKTSQSTGVVQQRYVASSLGFVCNNVTNRILHQYDKKITKSNKEIAYIVLVQIN